MKVHVHRQQTPQINARYASAASKPLESKCQPRRHSPRISMSTRQGTGDDRSRFLYCMYLSNPMLLCMQFGCRSPANLQFML